MNCKVCGTSEDYGRRCCALLTAALDMLQSGDTWDGHDRESLMAEVERRAGT